MNGLGTLYKAIFKVYDLGLYTTSKASNMQDLVSLPGPKKLHFVALRELPGTDLLKYFQAKASWHQMKVFLSNTYPAKGQLFISWTDRKVQPYEAHFWVFLEVKSLYFERSP